MRPAHWSCCRSTACAASSPPMDWPAAKHGGRGSW
jgi:hypothetical protein